MNLQTMMHRYYNIIFFLLVCSACGNGNVSRNSTIGTSTPSVADSTACMITLNRDSLYTSLMGKLDIGTHYAPVIRFLVDSLITQYNGYEDLFVSEFCLPEPHRYLTQMELDGLRLVTLREGSLGWLHYFLINPSDSIVWHHSVCVLRTGILDRTFRDWDGDGKKEIVEHRKNIVSGFVGTNEYVFSIEENRLKLLFCIELSLENYVGADSLGFGHLTRRSYKHIGKGLFDIVQQESRCDEEGKPHGKISPKYYTISADSLVKMYDNNEN